MVENINIENIILPNKPLSNFELIDSAKQLKIKCFRNVYLRDELPKKPYKKECGIINLADSDDMKGTHWVCYYKSEKVLYFDSYGIQPPIEIIDYLGKVIEYNTFQIQHFNQVICGHLCLYVLSKLYKKESFNDIIFSLIK